MHAPLVSQDAVGDLLGNMGGAGMRNMNADRRRHRIMQSRGTRALGEGPQAAAAIPSGPAAQSAQHRYLLRKKRKEKTTPFRVSLLRSPVLYRAVQWNLLASTFNSKQFFSYHRVRSFETSENRSNVKVLETGL